MKYYARAYFYAGEFERARETHEERVAFLAAQIDGDALTLADARIALANILQDVGQLCRSTRLLKEVARSLPALTSEHAGTAQVYTVQGRLGLARLRLARFYDFWARNHHYHGVPNTAYRTTDFRLAVSAQRVVPLVSSALLWLTLAGDYNDRCAVHLFAAQMGIEQDPVSGIAHLDAAQLDYDHIGCLIGTILVARTRTRLAKDDSRENLDSLKGYLALSRDFKMKAQEGQLEILIERINTGEW